MTSYISLLLKGSRRFFLSALPHSLSLSSTLSLSNSLIAFSRHRPCKIHQNPLRIGSEAGDREAVLGSASVRWLSTGRKERGKVTAPDGNILCHSNVGRFERHYCTCVMRMRADSEGEISNKVSYVRQNMLPSCQMSQMSL